MCPGGTSNVRPLPTATDRLSDFLEDPLEGGASKRARKVVGDSGGLHPHIDESERRG